MSSKTTVGELKSDIFVGCRVVFRMQPVGDTEYRFRAEEASRTRHGLALKVEGSEERRKVGKTRSFAPIPPPEPAIGTFFIPLSALAVVSKHRIRVLSSDLRLIATIRRG